MSSACATNKVLYRIDLCYNTISREAELAARKLLVLRGCGAELRCRKEEEASSSVESRTDLSSIEVQRTTGVVRPATAIR
jgi:hypothetical protein